LSVLQDVKTVSGTNPTSYAMGSGVLSWRVGRSGHEVDQSSKPNAEAKNGWSCTSTSTVCFHSVGRGNYFFFSVKRELSQPGKFMACIQKTQGSHLSGDTILAEPFPAFSQLLHPNACTIYQSQLSLQFIIH
jgi:hypothetical protein